MLALLKEKGWEKCYPLLKLYAEKILYEFILPFIAKENADRYL